MISGKPYLKFSTIRIDGKIVNTHETANEEIEVSLHGLTSKPACKLQIEVFGVKGNRVFNIMLIKAKQ